MSHKQHNEEGRIIYDFIPETETSYKYDYVFEGRIVTILNEKNRSNHTTIIEQIEDENGWYRDVIKVEYGDTYNITTLYDECGRQAKYEQINKIKKSSLTKTFHYPDNNATYIVIIDHNGKKDFGFKTNVKKLINKY